jgi:hypothetical protein
MLKKKIINLETRKIHEIDVIEKYDDQIVVFTEDKKCFPISKVEIYCKSFLSICLLKILKKQTPSKNQEILAIDELKKLNFIKFNYEKLVEHLDKTLV